MHSHKCFEEVNTATIIIAESGIVGHSIIKKCQLQGQVAETWNKCKGIKGWIEI